MSFLPLLDDGSQVANLDLTFCLDFGGSESMGEEHANEGDMVGEETQTYRKRKEKNNLTGERRRQGK